MGVSIHRSSIGLALAVLAGAAAAEAPPAQPGYYLGVLAGRVDGVKDASVKSGRPSLGWNIGYRFDETLSAELFARSLSFEPFLAPLLPDYQYPDTHVGAAVLASKPLGEGFRLYGRAGLGRTSFENAHGTRSGHRLEPSAGAGLGYDFGQVFGLKLEALRFTRSKVNTVTLGGEWRF